VEDPRYPKILIPIPEINRRQNHISCIQPNDPLLPIALECLRDKDIERPSAAELCKRVEVLKETAEYKSAHASMSENIEELQQRVRELGQEFQVKLEESEQQLTKIKMERDQEIMQKERQLVDREREIITVHERITYVEAERDRIIREKQREVEQIHQQLVESEQALEAQAKIREKAMKDLKHKQTIQELANLNLQKEDLKEPIGKNNIQ
jgi:hypothetical protein